MLGEEMKTRTLQLCLIALASVSGVGHAQQKNIQLRASHYLPAQHPLQASFQEWMDSVKKASGGSLGGTVFPAEQLGKAFDQYDMARDGLADIAYVSPGYQPGRFPVLAGASLPLMFANGKAGSAALDVWYRQYAAKEMKDVHFCLAFTQDPGSFHSRSKIQVPEDLRGLKVRPSNGTVGQFGTALGATNVQASAPESRDMLEKGVADAIAFPWQSIILFGIDKVVKYHLDAPVYASPFVWVMNKAKYESMSLAQKKVIDDHCTTEWAERLATPWANYEFAGRANLAAMSGHVMVKPTAAELALWRKAVEPVETQWANEVRKAGHDPKSVLDSLKQALAKYKSLF
jgi:TRAP-type C4-dicarboxylate transport system substrate-binding protein